MVSVRRYQELHPCWTQSAPAGSKIDPLLPKAVPIRKDDGSLVIMQLRKRKNAVEQLGESSEKM